MLDLGDIYQVAVAIRDEGGTLVSPSTAVLTIALPDGTTDTPTVPLPPSEVGIIRVDYTTVQPGRHSWRLATTGPMTAHVDAFNVVSSDWAAIVGLSETKRHLRIPESDTVDDEELRGFILSASAVVEDIVGKVARRSVTETNNGGDRHIVLDHSPVLDVVEVLVDGVLVDAGDYTASPSGLLARRSGRWPAGHHNITATYVVGREVVPANVINGTLDLIRVNWRPQAGGNYSAFDGGSGDDFGSAGLEASLQGNLRLGFFVPNTVVQRLQPDQRAPVVL
jgi:hypothetical protein